MKKVTPWTAGLMILLLTLPAVAQDDEGDEDEIVYPDEVYTTAPTSYGAASPSSFETPGFPQNQPAGVDFFTPNYDLFRTDYPYPWKQLYEDQKSIRHLKPLPGPFSRRFTGNPSRSGLQRHGNQSSYDIMPPPLVLPQRGPYAPYSYDEEPLPYSYDEEPLPYSYDEEPLPYSYDEEPLPYSYDEELLPYSYDEEPLPPPRWGSVTVYDPPPPSPPPSSRPASPAKPGRLTFQIHPADTRILLNDRVLGTGDSLEEGVSMKPGVYALEAEHAGYPTQRLMFTVAPEETVGIVIDLTVAKAVLEKSRSTSR